MTTNAPAVMTPAIIQPAQPAQTKVPISEFLEGIFGRDYEKTQKFLYKKLNKIGIKIHDFADRNSIKINPFEFPQHNNEIRVYDWVDFDKAYAILENYNTINRPIDTRDVFRWAISMLSGEWNESNPDALLFSADQTLLNGQHRLTAILVAYTVCPTIKIKFPIEFNKPKSIMNIIDINGVRTTADKAVMTMKQAGIKFDNDKYNGVKLSSLMGIVNSMFLGQNTPESMRIEFLNKHRDLVSTFYKILSKVPIIRFNASWAACFVKAALPDYYGKDVILPLAKRFAEQTYKVDDADGRQDPLKALHHKLYQVKAGKIKLNPKERYGLALKAVRKSLLEENIKKLHVTNVDWTIDEARDFKNRGKDSPVLKAFARKNNH